MNKKLTIVILAAAVLVLLSVVAFPFSKWQTPVPDSGTTSASSETVHNHFDIQLEPDRKSLPTRSKAEQIKENMTISHVYSVMGNPQRDVGSGAIILEWDLDTGEILRVVFLNDVSTSDGYYVMRCSILANPNA